MGIDILIIFLFTSVLALLSANYPNELNLEVKRFCQEIEDSSSAIEKDYFWFLRFRESLKSSLIVISSLIYASISFVLSLYSPDFQTFIFIDFILLLLFIIAIVDLQIRMIPDALPLIIAFTGLFFANDVFGMPIYDSIFGMFLGYFSMYLVLWITSVIMNKEAMGVGDVKLIAAIGTIIGPEQLPHLLLISSLIALVMLVITSRKKSNQQFAFGPYISMASAYLIINQSGIF